MGQLLRDDARALAETLARANEERDVPGTLRALEVDDGGTVVTLRLRIDDETSVSIVLMFEVRSRGEARAPSPPTRRERRGLGTAGTKKDLVFEFAPHAREPRTRIADDAAFLGARLDSLRDSTLPARVDSPSRALPSSRLRSNAPPRSALEAPAWERRSKEGRVFVVFSRFENDSSREIKIESAERPPTLGP